MSFRKDFGYKLMSWGDRLIKWYTRPKSKLFSIGKFLIVTGFVAVGATASFTLAFKSSDGTEVTASAFSDEPSAFIFIMSSTFILIGLILILVDVFRNIKDSLKANDILVEHIALFKPLSTSFLSSVTKHYGKVKNTKIDLSEHYNEGVLENPVDALNDTRVMLRKALQSLADATGHEQASIHYGGTPPVCLGFYSGFIIGNTTGVTLWDYDRDLVEWHPLDRSFNDNRPEINNSQYNNKKKEVCLILNISFDIEHTVRKVSPTDSIITVRMPKIEHDNMSSLSKLNKFKLEFRELLNKLNEDNIEKIHIYCAAQSSFNFSMGQQITKNHPTCHVYEYVNGGTNPYPWYLEFNNNKAKAPKISYC